ncbi:MAG TPA: hypothetical protein VLH39_00420 [Magnetospirillaceae bacterium]|nr:hypothetical protein [Magnetospirillaceae bacterium]
MCYACVSILPVRERIGFREACPDCGRPLHVCRNCRFFKPGAHWDCAETVGELVADKEKINFCDWFSMSRDDGRRVSKVADDAPKARSSFDDLFKP